MTAVGFACWKIIIRGIDRLQHFWSVLRQIAWHRMNRGNAIENPGTGTILDTKDMDIAFPLTLTASKSNRST